ncbi:hypothetical protein AX769_15025 [Frondihabitans sp. PAMC 28766]|nr:hypothetical protein AX769_15025 [Frondihabitans sp. PAMC 28766]
MPGAPDDIDPQSRTLVAEGLANALDLGGLRRRDRTETTRGVFFRSENVDRLSDAGWGALYDVGSAPSARGTTTEGAFRSALSGLDLDHPLARASMDRDDRDALRTWRGRLS